ncbi:hypothetical protein [Sphingopyxis sp.]|uniref:hypothetical protein n=1 Tax=Sphingopyxis sp. TaxID=1908224 RepID=UPI0035B2A473
MGKPLVENAHDIFERLVIVQYADEIGEYFHGKTVVKVRCSDGTVRNLDTALTRALNYWGDFLHTNGILEFTARPEPPIPGERFVAREDALRKMGLEARVGLDFKQDIEFLKFDESIGRAAPQNLDGMEFNANIYSVQKHIFDFKMTHPKIGEIVVSLPLTDQENLEYHLIFPDEREAFFKNLTISHRDELAKLINAEIEKLNLDDPALPPDQSK